MTDSLDLEFRKPAKNDLPGPANAYIYVKTYTSEKGQVFITPDCVTFGEFEEQIDRLKKELEAIRKKAKHKFSKKDK